MDLNTKQEHSNGDDEHSETVIATQEGYGGAQEEETKVGQRRNSMQGREDMGEDAWSQDEEEWEDVENIRFDSPIKHRERRGVLPVEDSHEGDFPSDPEEEAYASFASSYTGHPSSLRGDPRPLLVEDQEEGTWRGAPIPSRTRTVVLPEKGLAPYSDASKDSAGPPPKPASTPPASTSTPPSSLGYTTSLDRSVPSSRTRTMSRKGTTSRQPSPPCQMEEENGNKGHTSPADPSSLADVGMREAQKRKRRKHRLELVQDDDTESVGDGCTTPYQMEAPLWRTAAVAVSPLKVDTEKEREERESGIEEEQEEAHTMDRYPPGSSTPHTQSLPSSSSAISSLAVEFSTATSAWSSHHHDPQTPPHRSGTPSGNRSEERLSSAWKTPTPATPGERRVEGRGEDVMGFPLATLFTTAAGPRIWTSGTLPMRKGDEDGDEPYGKGKGGSGAGGGAIRVGERLVDEAPITITGVNLEDPRRKRLKKVSHYILGPLLGEGMYGVVRDAIDISATPQCAAIQKPGMGRSNASLRCGNGQTHPLYQVPSTSSSSSSSSLFAGLYGSGSPIGDREGSHSSAHALDRRGEGEGEKRDRSSTLAGGGKSVGSMRGGRVLPIVPVHQQFHRCAVKIMTVPQEDPQPKHKSLMTGGKRRTPRNANRGALLRAAFKKEVQNLQRFHCPYIMRAIDLFSRYGKEYMVLPIAICSLQEFIVQRRQYAINGKEWSSLVREEEEGAVSHPRRVAYRGLLGGTTTEEGGTRTNATATPTRRTSGSGGPEERKRRRRRKRHPHPHRAPPLMKETTDKTTAVSSPETVVGTVVPRRAKESTNEKLPSLRSRRSPAGYGITSTSSSSGSSSSRSSSWSTHSSSSRSTSRAGHRQSYDRTSSEASSSSFSSASSCSCSDASSCGSSSSCFSSCASSTSMTDAPSSPASLELLPAMASSSSPFASPRAPASAPEARRTTAAWSPRGEDGDTHGREEGEMEKDKGRRTVRPTRPMSPTSPALHLGTPAEQCSSPRYSHPHPPASREAPPEDGNGHPFPSSGGASRHPFPARHYRHARSSSPIHASSSHPKPHSASARGTTHPARPSLFSSTFIKGAFYQILSAVAYLHQQNLAHNDIKPSNILLFEDGSLRLTDLAGVSAHYKDQGTPLFTSPELARYYYGCGSSEKDEEEEEHGKQNSLLPPLPSSSSTLSCTPSIGPFPSAGISSMSTTMTPTTATLVSPTGSAAFTPFCGPLRAVGSGSEGHENTAGRSSSSTMTTHHLKETFPSLGEGVATVTPIHAGPTTTSTVLPVSTSSSSTLLTESQEMPTLPDARPSDTPPKHRPPTTSQGDPEIEEFVQKAMAVDPKACDMWCCGLVLYNLVTGKPGPLPIQQQYDAFHHDPSTSGQHFPMNRYQLYHFIADQKTPVDLRDVSNYRSDPMPGMTKRHHLSSRQNDRPHMNRTGEEGNPMDRETGKTVVVSPPPSPTLTPHTRGGLRDLLARLLELDPQKRLTAEEALRHPWMEFKFIRRGGGGGRRKRRGEEGGPRGYHSDHHHHRRHHHRRPPHAGPHHHCKKHATPPESQEGGHSDGRPNPATRPREEGGQEWPQTGDACGGATHHRERSVVSQEPDPHPSAGPTPCSALPSLGESVVVSSTDIMALSSTAVVKDSMNVAIQREVASRVLASHHFRAMILKDKQRHLQFVADCCQTLGILIPPEIFIPTQKEGDASKEEDEEGAADREEGGPLSWETSRYQRAGRVVSSYSPPVSMEAEGASDMRSRQPGTGDTEAKGSTPVDGVVVVGEEDEEGNEDEDIERRRRTRKGKRPNERSEVEEVDPLNHSVPPMGTVVRGFGYPEVMPPGCVNPDLFLPESETDYYERKNGMPEFDVRCLLYSEESSMDRYHGGSSSFTMSRYATREGGAHPYYRHYGRAVPIKVQQMEEYLRNVVMVDLGYRTVPDPLFAAEGAGQFSREKEENEEESLLQAYSNSPVSIVATETHEKDTEYVEKGRKETPTTSINGEAGRTLKEEKGGAGMDRAIPRGTTHKDLATRTMVMSTSSTPKKRGTTPLSEGSRDSRASLSLEDSRESLKGAEVVPRSGEQERKGGKEEAKRKGEHRSSSSSFSHPDASAISVSGGSLTSTEKSSGTPNPSFTPPLLSLPKGSPGIAATTKLSSTTLSSATLTSFHRTEIEGGRREQPSPRLQKTATKQSTPSHGSTQHGSLLSSTVLPFPEGQEHPSDGPQQRSSTSSSIVGQGQSGTVKDRNGKQKKKDGGRASATPNNNGSFSQDQIALDARRLQESSRCFCGLV